VSNNDDDDISANITFFENLGVFHKFENLSPEIKHITVVGGDLVASELALALAKRGKETGTEVVQVVSEQGVMAKYFPDYLSHFATEKLRKAGVAVRTGEKIESLDVDDKVLTLNFQSSPPLSTQHLVFALRLEPSTTIAKSANLEIDPINGGIVTNPELEARADIFAAGDVVSYYDLKLGRRKRMESYEHAVKTGETAALNMCQKKKQPFVHQSTFCGSIAEIPFEWFGIVDSSLETVGVWDESGKEAHDFSKKGVIYYFKENKLVGILLWNNQGNIHLARRSFDYFIEDPKIDNQSLVQLVPLG